MLKVVSLAVAIGIGLIGLFAALADPGSAWFWIWRAGGVALIGIQGVLANLAIRSAKRVRAALELFVYDIIGPLARDLSLLAQMKPAERN